MLPPSPTTPTMRALVRGSQAPSPACANVIPGAHALPCNPAMPPLFPTLAPALLRLLLLTLTLTLTLTTTAASTDAPTASTPLPTLTNAAAILSLPEPEARKAHPAVVTGVVTYYEPRWDTLFVQDPSAGIYVFPGQHPRPRLTPGDLVRVRGRTFGTQPLNALVEDSLETLGRAPIPDPIPIAASQLLAGEYDSRWVEFEATVRQWAFRFQRIEMLLSVNGSPVPADSPRSPQTTPPESLVHARVRVRAVASKTKDAAGNLTGIRVYVPSLSDYTILQPPPPDPFSLPRLPLAGLPASAADLPPDERRVVRGTVIHARREEIVIQDQSASIVVQVALPRPIQDPDGISDPRPEPPQLSPGDVAEAVGYLSHASLLPRLVDATVRRTEASASDPAPQPLPVTPTQILNGTPPFVLVELETDFLEELGSEVAGSTVLHRWRLGHDGSAFEAVIPESLALATPPDIQPGSRIHARGFIEPRPPNSSGSGNFRLHIRSSDDIAVRASSPRWLTREALRILSFSTIVILAILGWALLLWRERGNQRALNRELEARIRERTAELTEANLHLEEKVADQRRVEAALLESEARTRAILAHSPDGIVVLDPTTTRFVEANEAAAALFGVRRTDLEEKTPLDLSPPRQPDGSPSGDAIQRHLQRTLASGSHRFEWIHRDADGRDFPCEVNLALLPREGRMFIIGTLADVTARQRAGRIRKAIYEISEAANNAEDLPALYSRIHAVIRQLMNADNLYIASHDPTTNLLSFPYYVDERDPTPPTRPLARGLTEYVLRTGRPLLADPATRAELSKRGDCIPVGHPAALWLGVPLALRGRPFGVLAVQEYHDPTAFGPEEKDVLGFVAEQIAIAIDRRRTVDELRASEARLRESEERFSKAFHNCQGALAIVSLDDGRYLDVNEGFVRTYGYSRDEALGKTSLDLGLWQDPAHRERLFECLRATGSFRNEETVMRRRDGQILTTVESADVIEIAGRSCVIVFALDITDRKRAETELFHALRKERELSQLKTSFVSLVSHEFRTPLEIILSSGEILERYHDRLGHDQRLRQLRAITTSVRRMAHMMNEVLLLGRFDAGRMEFRPAPIDLPAFCQRVADDISAATDRRCPIHLDLQGDLSGAAGDEALLGHIFTNLLSNASKYSPPGKPVFFRLRREQDLAVFRVEDQGLGIPEADRPRLFSAFHRGSNVGQAPGSGLGLVIVRRCSDLHLGSLHWDSKEGSGTQFEVRLPLWIRHPDPLQPLQPLQPIPPTS